MFIFVLLIIELKKDLVKSNIYKISFYNSFSKKNLLTGGFLFYRHEFKSTNFFVLLPPSLLKTILFLQREAIKLQYQQLAI